MASSGGMVDAIDILLNCFKKYAGKEGDKNTLTKGECKDLFQNELHILFKDCKDQSEMDKIFSSLDANKDGTVDFQEYMVMIACIAMLCCRPLS